MTNPPGYGYPYPPPPYAYDRRPRLDRLMAQMRAHDDRDWGWRPVVVPTVTLAVLIVIGVVMAHGGRPSTLTGALAEALLLTLGLYAAVVASIAVAARALVRRFAGWGWTFGLQRPRWKDGAWLAAGVGMVFVGRIVVVAAATGIFGPNAAKESQNLTAHNLSPAGYAVLGILVVLVAPPVEELLFRGVMLRTMMWHWGFWPAALASSAIFAVFHVYEVDTFAGGVTLAAAVFALGLTNCLLVRWSGRLAAGIMVHALFNALALVVLALRD